ncbi:hypothetical protein HAZT_HAZT011632 [Hyalella azteca]|uniref:Transmembrane inner ear expressed protein n=1 Tax=Hyalella azteca TaxID=294128 RepID=A0A6A0H6A9_HYAAZ|nr:hypothetical protein HAZT_HAZT011632 [Hyalella azteca]
MAFWLLGYKLQDGGCHGLSDDLQQYSERPWEEQVVWGAFRRWHVIGISSLACLTFVCLLCRVLNCRVPRTKQEIEANYARRKLTNKFWHELRAIQNTEMDDMDLLKALERLRMELYNEETSLAQSDAFSALSFTPSGTTYRKGSEVNLGVSASELQLHKAPPGHGLKERVTALIAAALVKLRG